MSAATATDLQAAIKKALHSASFAKFMASAVQDVLAESQAQPQSVVLPPMAKLGRAIFESVGSHITYSKRNADWTHEIYLQCAPFSDDPRLRNKWYGHESRRDQYGQKWERSLGYHLVDDFGDLVKVPA